MVKPSAIPILRTAAAMGAVALMLLPAAAGAATITVDTTDDEYGDGTDCSLREAVRAANTNANYDGCSATGYGSDTISLGDGTYTLSLTGEDDSNAVGDLDTLGSLVIDGTGSVGHTTISGDDATRIVDVRSGSTTLQDLDLRDGLTPLGAGGAVSTQAGSSLT